MILFLFACLIFSNSIFLIHKTKKGISTKNNYLKLSNKKNFLRLIRKNNSFILKYENKNVCVINNKLKICKVPDSFEIEKLKKYYQLKMKESNSCVIIKDQYLMVKKCNKNSFIWIIKQKNRKIQKNSVEGAIGTVQNVNIGFVNVLLDRDRKIMNRSADGALNTINGLIPENKQLPNYGINHYNELFNPYNDFHNHFYDKKVESPIENQIITHGIDGPLNRFFYCPGKMM